MKKIISKLLFFIFFIPSICFALDYNDKIEIVDFPITPNTQTNIDWAKLIELYLSNLKKEITIFINKYQIWKDDNLNNFLIKIDKMISSLKKIQTVSLEKANADEVMRSIVKDLKILNPKIKIYLKNKKEEVCINTENIKKRYISISNKFSKSLSLFTQKLTYIINNSNYKNKKEILQYIEKIKIENNKLLDFKYNFFNNPLEVKERFLRILNNIKTNIIHIKNLI